MSMNPTESKPVVPGSVLDRELVERAFAEAAEEARWRAAVHGHTLVQFVDGETVEVDPGPPYVKKRTG